MPRYKVLIKSFINNTIVEQGDIVSFDGQPGANLELIKDSVKNSLKETKAKEPMVKKSSK